MSVATALVTGFEASSALAEAAVRQAMRRAGIAQGRGVLLFLSAHFSRQAQPAVLAAAKAAGCLQVFGMAAHGLFTESGWVLDQPAAAALVLGGDFALAPGSGSGPSLALSGNPSLPGVWRDGAPRFGLLQSPSPVWQQGRMATGGQGDTTVVGAACHLAVSTGLRRLGRPELVDAVHEHDLDRIGGLPAIASLTRILPAELRRNTALPLHQVGLLRPGDDVAIPILSANADGSLTLAERLEVGEAVQWTLRQPLAAETDMRDCLEYAAAACPRPAFGLMLSCIGRGPFFYGDDDRDLAILRARFPGLPVLGAYGSGQIAPMAGNNRQLHNSVVTALYQARDVQS